MNILSRLTVRQAVARAMLLGSDQAEASLSAAAALGLSVELVRECLVAEPELELEGASDSEGGEPV